MCGGGLENSQKLTIVGGGGSCLVLKSNRYCVLDDAPLN